MTVSLVKPMQMVGANHDALRTPAAVVDDWDEARNLAERMRVTLARRDGAGLAACQVGRPVNVVVLARKLGSHAYANIQVTASGPTREMAEGCLSMPGRWFLVPRRAFVKVEAFDLDTETPVSFEVGKTGGHDEFLARMWQHENDHMLGLLIRGRFPETRAPR